MRIWKFHFSSNLIFVGFTGSKNQVWTGKKFQLVLKSIFISVWNKCPNGYFKKPVQINRGVVYFAETAKLIYGPFGQSSKCSTLDFSPRLARKERNVPLYREAKSLLCMIKVVDVYNQRFLHIFFIAYQTNWFDFSKLDALEAPNLHEKLLISVPSNYHAICELWKLRRIFIELSQMIYFEFKSFLKKHYCFYSTALSRDVLRIEKSLANAWRLFFISLSMYHGLCYAYSTFKV